MLKQPAHVKALETGFFFPSPLFWLHPVPLTNVLGSQGATVLLSGPFPFLTPEVQAVAKVLPSPTKRIVELNVFDLSEKQWLKAFHFFGLLSVYMEDFFALWFSLWSPRNPQAKWQSDPCSQCVCVTVFMTVLLQLFDKVKECSILSQQSLFVVSLKWLPYK